MNNNMGGKLNKNVSFNEFIDMNESKYTAAFN